MSKPNRFIDIVISIICVVIMGQLFFWPIIGGFILMPNDNIVLILLLISVILKRHNKVNWQPIVFILLLLFAFNVITVSLHFEESDLTETHVLANIGGLSVEPIAFLILIIYMIINRGAIKHFIRKIFFESDEENESTSKEKVDFYYDMFSKFTPGEMNEALNIIDEYPHEAQIALIKVEKENKI
jgi:hypothetical protein